MRVFLVVVAVGAATLFNRVDAGDVTSNEVRMIWPANQDPQSNIAAIPKDGTVNT